MPVHGLPGVLTLPDPLEGKNCLPSKTPPFIYYPPRKRGAESHITTTPPPPSPPRKGGGGQGGRFKGCRGEGEGGAALITIVPEGEEREEKGDKKYF